MINQPDIHNWRWKWFTIRVPINRSVYHSIYCIIAPISTLEDMIWKPLLPPVYTVRYISCVKISKHTLHQYASRTGINSFITKEANCFNEWAVCSVKCKRQNRIQSDEIGSFNTGFIMDHRLSFKNQSDFKALLLGARFQKRPWQGTKQLAWMFRQKRRRYSMRSNNTFSQRFRNQV